MLKIEEKKVHAMHEPFDQCDSHIIGIFAYKIMQPDSGNGEMKESREALKPPSTLDD